jgi:hypothetical protein
MRIATSIACLLGVIPLVARGGLPSRETIPLSEVARRIDDLPRNTRYEWVNYVQAKGGTGRRLLVAANGGISSTEILPILRDLRIEEKWKWFPAAWRLSIRGDARYVRVTVNHSGCDSPEVWILTKRELAWYVIDLPVKTCEPDKPVVELVTPEPTELP